MKVELVNKKEVEQALQLAGWMGSVSAGLDPEKCTERDFDRIARHCLESGHLSVTRPVLFVFRIEGVSRALSHQFVRENVGVFIVQESQRYVKYDESMEIVVPDSIRNNKDAYEVFSKASRAVQIAYVDLLNLGIPAEDARFILTNATATKIHVALSFEALARVASKRKCNRAQWEIREMVTEMCNQVHKISTYLGSKLVSKCVTAGYCTEAKSCGWMPSKKEFFDTYHRGEVVERQYASHEAEKEALIALLQDPENVEFVMDSLFMHHEGLSASTLLKKIDGTTNSFKKEEETK